MPRNIKYVARKPWYYLKMFTESELDFRNKCDFVIGINPENQLPTVGFLLNGNSGTSHVGPVDSLVNISEGMKKVAAELERHVRSCDDTVPPFDVATGAGHWMGVVVRQTRMGQTLVNVSLHPQVNRGILYGGVNKIRLFWPLFRHLGILKVPTF